MSDWTSIRTFIVVCATSLILKPCWGVPPTGTRDLPFYYNRDLDSLDINFYFRNERLLMLQIRCILYDGPCDILGRWIKPRILEAIMGGCTFCTKYQVKMLPEWINTFIERFPNLFRAAVAQWLLDNDYPVPDEEIDYIKDTFKIDDMRLIVKGYQYPVPNITTTRIPRKRNLYTFNFG